MKTIYTPEHQAHHNHCEFLAGEVRPAFEIPERAEIILRRVQATKLGDVLPPSDFGLSPITRIHDSAYLAFFKEAWNLWVAENGAGRSALPCFFRPRGFSGREPQDLQGRIGYWSFDAACPIVAGTYHAALQSANVALTDASLMQNGERAAFALCRPLGHHAHSDSMGGYCYLNNAAIAAQYLLDHGAKRIAILDIDYHHGNGTQSIFYARKDVLVCNIHADPAQEYPYFLGYADETGEAEGDGYNLNCPLPHGTTFDVWREALAFCLNRIVSYSPDTLIVSLGVDTFKNDPISKFLLESEHYPIIGADIKKLNSATLFVMEGGYAVEEVGINAVGVLRGFSGEYLRAR